MFLYSYETLHRRVEDVIVKATPEFRDRPSRLQKSMLKFIFGD